MLPLFFGLDYCHCRLDTTDSGTGMHEARMTSWVRRAQGGPLRMEAFIAGAGYLPHRHDSYVFALTLQGVQSFHYRGSEQNSLPGGVVVMHPDALHDGQAGTDAGFRYRALSVEPHVIQQMLGGKALPFLEGGISTDKRLQQSLVPLLADFERPLHGIVVDDALFDLAHTLAVLCGGARNMPRADYHAAELARQYLLGHCQEPVTLATLERVSQRDRWKLSRDFRTAFGTSPYRYLTMRRLERARTLLADGVVIAEVAASCGFADQSHLTRLFRLAFGMTPKRWFSACRVRAGRTIIL
jgi:AraC-like DNA-binding protein